MQSDVRIVAKNGRLTEVTVNGAKMSVALDGLELRLRDGREPILKLQLVVLDLCLEGELETIIDNALPGDQLVSTRHGFVLLPRKMRNDGAQVPNEVSSCTQPMAPVEDGAIDAPSDPAPVETLHTDHGGDR